MEKLKPFLAKIEFLLEGKVFVTGNNPKLVDFELFELAELT